MKTALRLLGWGADSVWIGKQGQSGTSWTRVELGWQPADIRNCSWAAEAAITGISAQDRAAPRQVIAIGPNFRPEEVVIELPYVLAHALDAAAARVCYVTPSGTAGDLWVASLSGAREPKKIAMGGVRQGTALSWVPGGEEIVCESPDGAVQFVDATAATIRRGPAGEAPAAGAGRRLAYRRGGEIFLTRVSGDEPERALALTDKGRNRSFTGNLSWSPDGEYLSYGRVAGITDKESAFFVVELATGEVAPVEARHLRGLQIIG